jgi:hypothetical protein
MNGSQSFLNNRRCDGGQAQIHLQSDLNNLPQSKKFLASEESHF